MNPVLIYTDAEKIAIEKATLTKTVNLFQSVYNAFKDINIAVTIQEISDLISWTVNRNGATDFQLDFATDKLLDAAAPYELNGVLLSRERVRDLIVVPDVTTIIQALQTSFSVFNEFVRGPRVNLLSLNDDVISKVENSDSQIETLYNYYTKSDASALLATDLLAVCAAMNSFDGAHNNALKIADPKIKKEHGVIGATIPAPLKIKNNVFVINLDFIRSFEAGLAA